MASDRAFIFHIYISNGKTFSLVSRLKSSVKVKYQGHTSENLILKTLAITFERLVIELSYFTCVFLMARSFGGYISHMYALWFTLVPRSGLLSRSRSNIKVTKKWLLQGHSNVSETQLVFTMFSQAFF